MAEYTDDYSVHPTFTTDVDKVTMTGDYSHYMVKNRAASDGPSLAVSFGNNDGEDEPDFDPGDTGTELLAPGEWAYIRNTRATPNGAFDLVLWVKSDDEVDYSVVGRYL